MKAMARSGGDSPRHQRRGTATASASATARVKPAAVVLRAYKTEHAIYGTVLVSALVAVGWKFDTDWEVLVFIVGTVAVFWLSHIYSMVISREEARAPHGRALVAEWLTAAHEAVGMVLAMLVPAVFLLLATLGVLDEYVAYYIALWTGVGILAVLGFVNARRRGQSWPRQLVNASLTSAFGLVIIWLSTLVH